MCLTGCVEVHVWRLWALFASSGELEMQVMANDGGRENVMDILILHVLLVTAAKLLVAMLVDALPRCHSATAHLAPNLDASVESHESLPHFLALTSSSEHLLFALWLRR